MKIPESEPITVAGPKYELIRPLGVVTTGTVRKLEVNVLRWNDSTAAEVDLRWWVHYTDGTRRPCRGGLRLSSEEARTLMQLLQDASEQGVI